jgi:flagellar biogenesis protein FliO
VLIPLPPEDTSPAFTSGSEAVEEEPERGSGWIAQLILGIIGILVFFGFFALIISRMVALMRR